MENFDFNIDNYSIKNMEDFLNLPYNNYTDIEINEKVQTMKDTLLNSKESREISSKINTFLNDVHQSLLLNNRNRDTNTNTNHYLNKTKHLDINNVYNYKYVTGTVNPIERQTQKKSVCINSLFRTNYFKSDSYAFDYVFPTPIENIISMKLAFVEIPFFWYGISAKKKNNTFIIKLYNVMTSTNTVSVPDSTHTITIEDGNYTTSLLTTYLNNYFTYNGVGNGLNYLIFSISEIDSKITFRAKTPLDDDTINPFDSGNFYYSPDFTYEIIFSDTPFFDPENNYSSTITDQYSKYLKSAASILGFKLNTYTVTPTNTYYDYSTATTYNAYLRSDYSYGKYVYQYLFLEVNDYHNNFTTDSVLSLVCNNKYVSNNILSVLPVIGNQNTIMFDKTSGENISREYFGPVKLTKLTIRILNQYGEVLDLNGYDYFIILELQQIYSNYNIL
jgi:hypothetical protein